MGSEDFINRLDDAGWSGLADAQHTKIIELWKELFPVNAKLEAVERELYEAELKLGE